MWYECRHLAVEFLKEAYDIVARNLKKVEELFPFVTQKAGLKVLEKIASEL